MAGDLLFSLLNLTLNLCTLPFVLSQLIFLLSQVYNSSTPRESASVLANYLRCHFSVSQPKTLHSRTRGYLSKLHKAMCPEEYHLSFCSSFSPAKFLAASTNLSSSTASFISVAYPMLKHLYSLWHGSSPTHFQFFQVFAFLSFHLEDILYYSHPLDGKAS